MSLHLPQSVDSSRLSIDKSFDDSSLPSSSPHIRQSTDSFSLRPSLDLRFQGSNEVFSPLGPNSIFEVVMNTRLRNWLKPPVDIPPVALQKVTMEANWREKVSEWTESVAEEMDEYRLLSVQNLPPASAVPDIFYEDGFQLDNPAVFHQVLPFLESHLPEEFEQLQDSLSMYLDSVEHNLVNEISSSSEGFYKLLSEVHKVKDTTGEMVGALETFARELAAQRVRIQDKLRVYEKMQKRKNVEKLEQSLLQVKTVLLQFDIAKKLFSNGEMQPCLDKLKQVDLLINGKDEAVSKSWPYKLLNLENSPILSKLLAEMNSLREEIGAQYIGAFTAVLVKDLESLETDDETLARLIKGTQPAVETSIKDEIRSVMASLESCQQLDKAFKAYEDAFIVELKNIIKKFLPREGKLTQEIQKLSPVEFQAMLEHIYCNVSRTLRRLSKHQKLLLDLSGTHDLRQGISEGINIVQTRMGKIISVRREMNSKLGYEDFIRFYGINSVFSRECEAVSGDFLTQFLNDVIKAQTKLYFGVFRNNLMLQVGQGIDQEPWKPVVVDAKLQGQVDEIVASSERDVDTWSDFLLVKKSTEVPQESGSGHKKSVVVNENTFVASESLLATIKVIYSLLVLNKYFSNWSVERMLLDLFRFYNTRAMSAVQDSRGGLNTNKNLGILGESLDCLAELLMLTQLHFRRLGKSSNGEFYLNLHQQYKVSSDKIIQARMPPPI